jgi:tetratricopeptide (TPR) repeat protein
VVRAAAVTLGLALAAVSLADTGGLTIDYPPEGALFPADLAAPTFLWRDSSRATAWRIEIVFGSGAPPLRFTSRGPHRGPGEIDEDCVSTTNERPQADPRQRSWRPGAAAWERIKSRSKTGPATVTLTGLAAGRAVSKAAVRIETSADPVGAPIFYRDVPLMPSETEKGVIKPLAPYAVRLVKWRLRHVNETQSRVVLERLPMCANCHSFSSDGRRMGMDLDGLRNNKGRYFLAEVQPEVTVRAADVIQWTSAQGRLENPIRVGFMSQLSPRGDTVVTTVDTPGSRTSNYYVANFADYRFLQVFFPTRGILAWYNRAAGVLQPLAGADDPAWVQFGAVWSPDGEWLVFARARAQDPDPPGLAPARFANDPNELQIRYDLYRIPFHGGRGGRAEPIAGASANGMSNTFPKVSPDGRWIVFVKCRNGQLMRPDSELWMVPAAGGAARRLRSNTPRMNSWHSFSPNGRWLVFSSKARSPYTEMYLTHLDEEGNDSPPILVENATAANRAVNLPEFVNLPAGGLRAIGGPALDYYRLYDRALYWQKERRYAESAAVWKKLVEIAPEDADVRRRLGLTLLLAGRRSEAASYLGAGGAAGNAEARASYEGALASLERGDKAAALAQLRRALALDPNDAAALGRAAWILATDRTLRNGPEALALAVRALERAGAGEAAALDTLAAAYAENHRFEDAIATARRAMAADPARAPAIERRIERYQAREPWRE